MLGVNGFDRGFLDSSSGRAAAGGGEFYADSSGDILEEISWTISPRSVRNKEVGDRVDGDGVEELFMEQRLDHFDRQETRTFDQRYFVNKA